jgi:ABC-2 type transport system ATP-binding protein
MTAMSIMRVPGEGIALSSLSNPPAEDESAAVKSDPAPPPSPYLQVSSLAKSFGQRKVVDGVSFSIAQGECFGLLGPNGAGKTTTILALCGLARRDGGVVAVDGDDPFGSKRTNLAARRRIGYVPQEIALYDDLSGSENLEYFGKLYGLRRSALAARVQAVLEFVDLTGRARERVAVYSGGMKRRLNIAAALLHEPRLIVLDEPTVGVDPQSRNLILSNLETLRDQGVSLLYTSHYMEEVERICDRVGIMDNGRLLAEGTVQSLIGLLGEQVGRVSLSTDRRPPDALIQQLETVDGVTSATATADGPVLSVLDVARTLPKILAVCAETDIQINRINVEQPDLEDVFLHLTGRALRDV